MDISLTELLSGPLIVGLRVSGLMLFAPFFGNAAIPPRVKVVMVLVITAVLYPVYGAKVGIVTLAQWPGVVARETMIGMAIGLVTNFVFESAQLAGSVLGVQMGYSLVNILDPQTQVETNVLSVFHQNFLLLVFLALNAHHWILRAVARSFDYLPPGSAHLDGAFVTGLLAAAGLVLKIGIQIAAPILGATMAADLFLGLLSRASPQLPLLMLGPAIKGLFGVMLLSSVMRYWPELFSRLFAQSMMLIDHLLHLAR